MKKILKMMLATFTILLATTYFMPTALGERANVYYQTELDYPPFKFKQNSSPTGFDLELTQLIFRDGKNTLLYSSGDWMEVYQRLKQEDIDTAGLVVVNNHNTDMIYSKPVMQTYTGVYVRRGFIGDITLESLSDYKVGVAANRYSEELLKQKTGVTVYRQFQSVEEGLIALKNGSIDLLFENQHVVNYLIVSEKLTGDIHQVLYDLYPLDVSYAVKKSSPELVTYINSRIDELRGEEMYEYLYQKYFFDHSKYYKDKIINRYILLGCVIALLIVLSYILLRIYIKYLKKTLYEERELSKEVLDHTNMLVWAVHKDKRTVRFNQYAELLTGMKESDLTNQRYDQIEGFHERYSGLVDLLDNAIAMKFVDNQEMTLTYGDQNQSKMFLFRTSAIRDASGRPEVFIIAGMDIEERKIYENKLQSSYEELESTYEELAATQEELERQFDELIVQEDKLRISEERFRLATMGSGAVIWDTVPDTNYYFVSERMFELLGYGRGEVSTTLDGWMELIHPQDMQDTIESRQAYLRGESPVYEKEYRMRKKDGSYIWIQARGMLQRNSEGRVIRFAGSMIDVTDRKNYELRLQNSYEELEATFEELTAAQDELRVNYETLVDNQEMLRRNEERYRLVTEASDSGIWETDVLANQHYFSPRWYELLGYDVNDLVSFVTLDQLVHPDDYERYLNDLEIVRRDSKGMFQCEYRLRLKSGDYRWFMGRGRVLYDDQGHAYRTTGSITDIHELKKYQDRLQHLAYYDALSDLPNRLYLLEELEAFFSNPQEKAALFFVDTDNFKYINDTLGHKFGDRLLKETSSRLASVIEDKGMLFRLGGDEFVIFLQNIHHEEQALLLAEHLMQGFLEPFQINESEVYVSVSIGIAIYPQHGVSAEEILKNADMAMYAAKEAGKGKYMVFDQSFLQVFNERVNLEKYLRQGLQNGEFQLFYQPQVSVRNGHITGFEALIRWNSPELGFVSPLSFIKIAEDSRLIIPIGEWVLFRACAFASSFQEEGYGKFKISVNISVIQMLQDDFIDMVMRALEDTGLEPDLLELEITETLIMESFDALIPKLAFLRSKGIQIALDDFGTGYSSLGSLQDMPITTLKIDKTFIEQVSDEGDPRSLAKAIVLIGRKMGLKVVAEGVETEQQMKYVKRAKCDMIQGYYISKPLSEEDTIQLIRSKKVYDIRR
ncbi:PAS domain S-box-containing protein/diguanylate cyclase (GGDEF) domain-containing protein [Fontibacillus panacisegetis]|uniref:PAS domain S-box-containing protein/diguanylate cyclase (GGDEF) domain-containing protein n=1 Tax=Fontibacillus panacisegetis TaxID=670482 RepID=A0A1G7T9R4_9BACL|nr:EAL domain-containing protein [Fontibacillus panacisegetis]SDG32063.1 PAS domain S-box-containing protein/diguanylate cyclase (GGDEF) domain-containing protein [Fontibacillus panacisegetis]